MVVHEAAKDAVEHSLAKVIDRHNVEVPEQPRRNGVASAAGWTHGRDEVEVDDLLERLALL
jgi:hypothetical protein